MTFILPFFRGFIVALGRVTEGERAASNKEIRVDYHSEWSGTRDEVRLFNLRLVAARYTPLPFPKGAVSQDPCQSFVEDSK